MGIEPRCSWLFGNESTSAVSATSSIKLPSPHTGLSQQLETPKHLFTGKLSCWGNSPSNASELAEADKMES